MSRSVKRSYSSPLRAEQALVTKRAIVGSAAALFGAHGYVAVSVDAIAGAAGVSRATVFTTVGGKAELLRAAFRAAFGAAAGAADEAMPLVERPRSREVRASPTALGYLSGYAQICTAIHRHMALIYEAIREAARADPDVASLWREINEERHRGAHTIVADVRKRASLRAGLPVARAADLVWMLNDPVHYHMLVLGRGWPESRFTAWLARALEMELLRD
ncbi:MAG: helix-turn-helix domain-containing protein [Deltaproteobacteria bacterium]